MVQGLIGKKIGMTRVISEDNTFETVTVIEAGPCVITQVKTVEKDGYNAAQLGFGQAKKLNAAMKGHMKELGAFKYLREFKVGNVASLQLGQVVDASIFKTGSLVNVSGVSKGKGFAGVVKRHNFSGGPKTHGQSDRWRAPGSIGAGTSPGRVWKGQKMPGHMGNQLVKQLNLKVFLAEPGKNILLLHGAIPGAKNTIVLINQSNREKR